jgi:hypothetical protein
MELDLRHHPPRLFPSSCLTEETLELNDRLVDSVSIPDLGDDDPVGTELLKVLSR